MSEEQATTTTATTTPATTTAAQANTAGGHGPVTISQSEAEALMLALWRRGKGRTAGMAPQGHRPHVLSWLAGLVAAMVPRFIGARWRWWRSATGGRWVPFWYRTNTNRPWEFDSWRLAPLCPHQKGCSFMRNSCGFAAGCEMDGECRCEVWS